MSDQPIHPRRAAGTGARALLLGGTALCAIAVASMATSALAAGLPTPLAGDTAGTIAAPNALTNSAKFVAPGSLPTYGITGNVGVVATNSSRSLISWTNFGVATGQTLNFTFHNTTDTVINRVTGGPINIDTGGVVNGQVGSAATIGGNIWFLADGGVFIHGTVNASGVIASNNTDLSDATLLNPMTTPVDLLTGNAMAAKALIEATGTVVAATNATLDAAGNIVLGGDLDVGAGGVEFNATGTIMQIAGVITAGKLDSTSAGAQTLTGANQVATLGAFANGGTGDLSFTDATSAGLTVNTAIDAGANNLTLTTTGSGAALQIAATLRTDFAHGVNLSSAGSVSETAGFIQTGTLAAASNGPITLTGPGNAFNTLGLVTDSGAGPVSITDAGDLTLAFNVNAGAANTLNLTSGGTITQTGGVISAGTLNSTSTGAQTLNGANQIGALGTFANNGMGDLSFTDAIGTGLTINTAIDAGANNLNLTTTATGAPLTLAANLTTDTANGVSLSSAGAISQSGGTIATGTLAASSSGPLSLTAGNSFTSLGPVANTGVGDVSISDSTGFNIVADVNAGSANTLDLSAQGTITQTAGVITAGTLNSTSNGAQTLSGPNQVGALGTFANGEGGDLSFTDAIAAGLTITNSISAGAGNLSLTTTASGAPLTLAADLTTNSTHQTSLSSAGAINQTAGTIATETLAASSNGPLSLTDANSFTTLGFVTDTGAGPVSIVDVGNLILSADVNAGAGNVLNLTSGGQITQPGGVITAGTLNSTSAGKQTLNEANQVATLGTFANGGTGDLAFTDALGAGLTVATAINAGVGNLNLTTTAANAPLTLAASISTDAAHAIALTSAGAIAQTAGAITTATLNSASVGAQTLNDANQVGALGVFADGGVGGLGFTDAIVTGLTVNNAVAAGAGNLSLTTTAAGAALVLAANVSTDSAHGVSLTSAGPVTQAAGTITTGNLAATSHGPLSLAGFNTFMSLGPIDDTGAGDVSINDTTGFTIAADLNAGPANMLTLVAGGSITQAAGVITASTLNSTSVGAQTLNDANQVGALGTFTDGGLGGLAFTDAIGTGLTINNAIAAGAGNLGLATTAAGAPLTLAANLSTDLGHATGLNSQGAIIQNAGTITTGTLSGSSVLGTTLESSGNVVNALSGFANTVSGPIELVDSVALAIAGAVTNLGGDVAIFLPTAGSITGPGILQASGDIAMLSAQGGIALASANAGDDIVLRAPNGAIAVSGLLISGAGSDTGSIGAGDTLATSSPMLVFGNPDKPLIGGGTVDLLAQGVTVGGPIIAGTSGGVGSDIRIVATNAGAAAIGLASATANQDIALDATSAAAGNVSTGALLAGRDVAIRSVAGSLTLASGHGGDDVLLRAAADVTATGTISSGTGADGAGAADDLLASSPGVAMTVFGVTYGTLAGSSPVDIRSGGAISLAAVTAQNGGDIRLQTTGAPQGAISFASLNAAGDVVVDGGSTGGGSPSVTSGRDVVISGGVVTLGSVSAGDDILLRSSGSVTTGQLTSGTVGESLGIADAYLTNNPGQAMTAFGHTYASVADGSQIDVVAAGSVTVGGPAMALGAFNALTGSGSDARLQSLGGSVGASDISAGRDVVIDAAIVGSGALTARRDVAAYAHGGIVAIVSASAGDDVVLRSPNDTVMVSGILTSGTGGDASGAGDALATASPMLVFGNADKPLTGGTVDVLAKGVTVGGATTAGLSGGAGSDIRIVATGPGSAAISLGSATANGDIALDATAATDGGVSTGGLLAGRDVAIRSVAGNLTLASASAVDDLVLRAPVGTATVNGALNSGSPVYGVTSIDDGAAGAGDALAALSPMTTFAGPYNVLTGGNAIDVVAGTVTVTGQATATGIGSDARFQALTGSVTTADVLAGRDVVIDAFVSDISGNLTATRDVASRALSGGAGINSASAGDDVVLRAPGGSVVVSSGLTAGVGADASGAGDALTTASPLTLFGNADKPLTGGGAVDLLAQTVTIGGATTAGLAGGSGSDIRIVATGAGAPTISLNTATANGDVALDATAVMGGGVSAAMLLAGRDVAVRSVAGSVSLGSASAGDDAALRAGGSVTAGSLTTGTPVNGTAIDDGAAGAGDALAVASPITVFGTGSGHAFTTLTGGRTIDVAAGVGAAAGSSAAVLLGAQATATGAASDARFQAPGAISVAAVSAGRDVLLDGSLATTGSSAVVSALGPLLAGRDVAVRSGLGPVNLASAEAGDDLVIRAATGVTVTGGLTTDGASTLDPNAAGHLVFDPAPTALNGNLSLDDGSHIDVKTPGSILVGGPSLAATDARFQAGGSLGLAGVSAGRDILVDAGSAVTAGALQAGRDIAGRSATQGISIPTASAGDDIVLRASNGTVVVSGTLSSGTGPDGVGAGDALAAASPMTTFAGPYNVLTGSGAIDVVAGTVTVIGQAMATGSDARFQALTGSVTTADVLAGRDVVIDAAMSDTSGNLTATRDVASWARGGVVGIASASAGDDVVLRAPSGTIGVSGALTSGTGADASGAGDSLATASPLTLFGGADKPLTGAGAVDVLAQSVTVGGATTAGFAGGLGSDIRIVATGASAAAIGLGAATANQDIALDATATTGGGVTTGTLLAGRDVAIRSVAGNLTLASASASDDVVLRAGASVMTVALTTGTSVDGVTPIDDGASGAGDALAGASPMTVLGTGTGHAYATLTRGQAIDVVAGTVTVTDQTTATGAASDARFQALGALSVAGVSAGRDVLLDGSLNTVGSVATVSASGPLLGGRDVAVRSGQGAVSLVSAEAGDDLVIRASTGVMVAASLTTDGVSTLDPNAAGHLVFDPAPTALNGNFGLDDGSHIDVATAGSILVGGPSNAFGDARFQAGGSIGLASVTAGRDILTDAGLAVTTGALQAGRDIAARSATLGLSIPTATAGDDIVLRATAGTVTATALTSGTGADASGAGDALATASPMTVFGGADKPLTGGGTVDVLAQTVTVGGAATAGLAGGAGSDIRIVAKGAGPAAIGLGSATANGDIALDATAAGGGSASTGGLLAGRDVAIRSVAGSLTLASASAGDDLVLRAPLGIVTANGALNTASPVYGVTSIDDGAAGAGDALAALSPMTTFAGPYNVLTGGNAIDVVAGSVTITGQATATGIGSDARFQALTGSVTTADVLAGRDGVIDAFASDTSGNLTANRDVASWARGGVVGIASASAGDDVVLRAPNGTMTAGTLTSGTGADASGAGDALATASPLTLFGGADKPLSGGGTVDVLAQTVTLSGATTAGLAGGSGSGVRIVATGAGAAAVGLGSVTANQDVALDATAAGGGSVSTGVLQAGRDVAIRSVAGSLTLASASAGDDAVLRASGSVTVNGVLATGAPVNGTAIDDGASGAGDALATLSPMKTFSGVYGAATGGQAIDVVAATVGITGQATATGAGSDARLQALTGAVTTGGVSAGGDVVIDAATSDTSGALAAGRDAAVWARGGSVNLASASAGDDIVLRAPSGTIAVSGGLTSGAGADATGAGDALASSSASPMKVFGNPDSALTGGGTVDALATSIGVSGAIKAGAGAAGSDVRVVATGADAGGASALTLASATATGDVALDATAASGGGVSTGALIAGRDVAVRSVAGGVTLASAKADDDAVIVAAAKVTLNGGVTATGKAISSSGAGQTLYALNALPTALLPTSGKSLIFIKASSYSNTVGPLQAFDALAFDLTTGNVSVGDATSSEVVASTLQSPNVYVFAPNGITVGKTSLPAALHGTFALYTAGTGAAGAGAPILINGTLAPAADNTVALVIGAAPGSAAGTGWTPSNIEVDNNSDGASSPLVGGGSIGSATLGAGGVASSALTFASASLTSAGNILVGSSTFDTVIGNPSLVAAQINPIIPRPALPYNNSKSITLAVGNLTLSAPGRIIQQNTSGFQSTVTSGSYITGTVTLVGYTAPGSTVAVGPQNLDLFGEFANPLLVGPTVALSSRIKLGSLHSPLYRINSCVIGSQGNCTPTGDPVINIEPDQIIQGSLLRDADLLDIEDPTITGAANEEIWRKPE